MMITDWLKKSKDYKFAINKNEPIQAKEVKEYVRNLACGGR